MNTDARSEINIRKERIKPLRLGRYRGEILSPYDDPSFLAAISSPERLLNLPGARVLLDSRNRVSALSLTLSDGTKADVVIKEFFPRGIHRLKSLFERSRAERAWRRALALRERGLDTPCPVAYLEARREAFPGFIEHAIYIAEEIKPAAEIRAHFLTRPATELQPLLVSLAAHLFLSHEKGVLHRDLSDGNILVQKDESGKFRFFFLDTTRIRLRRRLRRLSRIRNLIRLGIPAELRAFFLTEYFRCAGWGDSIGLRLWYKINKGAFATYMAIKRKLGLRKIARKLGIQ